MSNLIRSFIAIPLTPEIRGQLAILYESVQLSRYPQLREVKPEIIHLTLKFLGDALPVTLEKVSRELNGLARITPAFSISFHGLGAFPGWRNPRVLWVGVDVPNTLVNLSQAIEQTTQSLGFRTETRGFNPHLTIARVNDRVGNSSVDLSTLKQFSQPDLGTMAVKEMVLFRSDLRPSGPIYTRLSTHLFQGD